MHGAHRTPQHRNGDFHWFLHTRFCRVVAQLVIVALLLVDVPIPTDHQAVAEATGSSSFQPRIIALAPSCVARGANFKITLANFDRTSPLTVKVGGVVAVIVSTTTLSSTTKKLVVTMPQTAPAGRTTVTVSNNKPQSASKTIRVRQAEICGNSVDDDIRLQMEQFQEIVKQKSVAIASMMTATAKSMIETQAGSAAPLSIAHQWPMPDLTRPARWARPYSSPPADRVTAMEIG